LKDEKLARQNLENQLKQDEDDFVDLDTSPEAI
jgi:hypothetical protein